MGAVTTIQLVKMKQQGDKIASLTAYDAAFAAILDTNDVDVVLVGDSLGMVVQGHDSTLPVTLEQMIYHCQAVTRRCVRALVMVDMPFMSYAEPGLALRNAGRLMQEGGAKMVKLEGGAWIVDTVRLLTQRGIPVCAHLGLTPQSVHQLGGYRMQGRTESEAQRILNEAQALAQAGASLLIVECVPESLAAQITASLSIPVIGIGAGPHCDGQILVVYDILGLTPGKIPGFSRNFLVKAGTIDAAVKAYVQAVKNQSFPAACATG